METSTLSTEQRIINIPGVTNLRDVGGYPAGNSALTKWGTLLRSGTMHGLDIDSDHPLRVYGVRTIIDLRRPSEIRADPQPHLGSSATELNYRNISLLTDEIEQARRNHNLLLPDIYQWILDRARIEVGEAVSSLAEPGAFPAIVRCTAGKDRTGVIIALMLRIAGVPDDTIVYDYALSQKSMETEEFITYQRAHILAGGSDWDYYRNNFLISPADFMRQTLAYIDSEYGSACGYLQQAGMDVSTINALRLALVEPRS